MFVQGKYAVDPFIWSFAWITFQQQRENLKNKPVQTQWKTKQLTRINTNENESNFQKPKHFTINRRFSKHLKNECENSNQGAHYQNH